MSHYLTPKQRELAIQILTKELRNSLTERQTLTLETPNDSTGSISQNDHNDRSSVSNSQN